MYLSADQLSDGTLLQGYDICIVGAGAAGLAMAKRLIGTSRRVLVLASGLADDKGRPEAQRQSIYKGTVGDFLQKVDPVFLHRSRLHMYGGTTNHFGFWSRPLDEIDLRPRPGYRRASWPISSDELAGYYANAHHFGRFGPFNYDDMPFWERVLYARCFPTQAQDELTGAIMHAQYEEDLHDFQVQFGDELSASSNVTILFNANLLNINTVDGTHVSDLECACIESGKAGRHFRVAASTYTLAMGGVETVRMLKLAGNLGDNSKRHLGRGFMMHPLITSAATAHFSQPVATDICNFFRDQQVRLQPPAFSHEPYTHVSAPLVNPEDVFNYCVFNAWGVLVPTPSVLDAKQIGNFRLILRFNTARDAADININWEQIPNENSTITLSLTEVDPVFGQPVAHVDWQMLDEDKHTAVEALKICESYLRERGAVDFNMLTDLSGGADQWVFAPKEGALATGDHHMGALRMAEQPDNGIVNINSRLHAVDNLYIAGCAVFPTGGFANPTLTIVALALRLADHLKML